MKQILTFVASAFLVLAASVPAMAQAPPVGGVPDPRFLQFTVSPDHNSMMLDGTTPVVTRYEWRVFAFGTPVPFLASVNLGKPTAPNGATINFDSQANCGSVPNCTPMAALFSTIAKGQWDSSIVAAIGPAGEGVSPASNPFGFNKAPGAAAGVTIKQ